MPGSTPPPASTEELTAAELACREANGVTEPEIVVSGEIGLESAADGQRPIPAATASIATAATSHEWRTGTAAACAA